MTPRPSETAQRAVCVLQHVTPKTATDGLLCAGHASWLADTVADIPVAYALLALVEEPGSGEPGVKVKRMDPPAPVRLDVVAMRDRRTVHLEPGDPYPVLYVVESWARLVREERHLAVPTVPATMTSEANLLIVSLDWILAQPWVDDFAAEVRRAARCLHDALGEHAPRPVGRCPVVWDDGECGGPLYQDRYGFWRVTCGWCGAVWDEDELRRLGLVMGG